MDPYGGDFTEFLYAHRKIEDAICHGITKTCAGEIRAGAMAGLASFLNLMDPWPTTPAGMIKFTIQYVWHDCSVTSRNRDSHRIINELNTDF